MERRIGVIIQARMGSTRLPNKVLTPIFSGSTILDILIDKLEDLPLDIVVATSLSEQDDVLEDWGKLKNQKVFRGSENDVLKRFIDCGDKYDFDYVVRVCADNPFLDVSLLKTLISHVKDQDYLSFITHDKTPVIKTHYGVFCEIVSLNALKKVQRDIDVSEADKQHVTSFIYANEGKFNIKFIELPQFFSEFPEIRLTIDTQSDFDSCQELLQQGVNVKNVSLQELFKYVSNNPGLASEMKTQIKINSK